MISLSIHKNLPIALALFSLSASAHAAVLSVAAHHGSHGGQGFGYPVGNLPNMTDRGNVDTSVDPDDPSTWTVTTNAWQQEWQSNALLDPTASANNKIAWVAIDLGAVMTGLDQLFIWNQRETTTRFTGDFNIYIASTPTIALPADSGTSGFAADVGAPGGAGDYDFASGGWTQIGSTATMSTRVADGAFANEIIDLNGASARFIAIEILTNTGDANRVGINEIAVTQIPEPTTALLGSLGFFFLLRRRR